MPPFRKLRVGGQIPAQEWVVLLLLGLLMVGSWFLVHGVSKGMYDQFSSLGDPPAAMGPTGDTGRNQLGHWGYFWSERAFHYRTTLMFAVDDYDSPSVLSQDAAQQFPEGVNSWRQYTLLMEPIYGQLYRWFAREGEILAEFLLRLIPLIHVLMFLPLYAAARGLGARPIFSLLAVVVFASCSLGFARVSGSLLLKENFALFWMALFLALHFWALRRRDIALLVAAALVLVVFLASWHLSQFLILVILGATALTRFSSKQLPQQWAVLVPGVYLVAALLAGLTPSLQERGFFLSLPVMLLLAWLAAAWFNSKSSRLPGLVIFAGIFLVLGAVSFLNRHFSGDYNHIFGLLVQKFVHGFSRPDDPSVLPFDARVFWASPFNSPSWPEVWSKLGYHFFLVVFFTIGGLWLGFKKRLKPAQLSLLLMALALLLGWGLVERLGVVFWPVGMVLLAVVLETLVSNLRDKYQRWPLVLGTALLLIPAGVNLATVLNPQIRVARDVAAGKKVYLAASDQVVSEFRKDLFQWVARNTPGKSGMQQGGQAQAVLGDIGVSPQILLYTGRPVVLNSQFENQFIRQRYHNYLSALFSEEATALQDFLTETKTGYLFINRNWATSDTPGSAAYLAGLTGPLTPGMNIARLHFNPESYPFLRPVYNNEYYRLFKVGVSNNGPATWERNHGSWWNISNFTISNGQFTDLQEDRRRMLAIEDAIVALQNAQTELLMPLERSRRPGTMSLPALHQKYLELKLMELLENSPPGQDSRTQISQVVQAIQQELKRPTQPKGAPLGQELAALYTRGLAEDRPGWQQLLERGANEPVHLASAAQLLALLGQYQQAAELMLQAAELFPEMPTLKGDGQVTTLASPLAQRIRQAAVGYLVSADQTEQAASLASAWVKYAPVGSTTERFFQQVTAISGQSP